MRNSKSFTVDDPKDELEPIIIETAEDDYEVVLIKQDDHQIEVRGKAATEFVSAFLGAEADGRALQYELKEAGLEQPTIAKDDDDDDDDDYDEDKYAYCSECNDQWVRDDDEFITLFKPNNTDEWFFCNWQCLGRFVINQLAEGL